MPCRDFYMTPHFEDPALAFQSERDQRDFEEAHRQLEQTDAGKISPEHVELLRSLGLLLVLENIMSAISELSANVERLIAAANEQKSRADNPPVPPPMDDPEVVALNERIAKAIVTLTGAAPVTPEGTSTAADPNAPAAG